MYTLFSPLSFFYLTIHLLCYLSTVRILYLTRLLLSLFFVEGVESRLELDDSHRYLAIIFTRESSEGDN